MSVILAKNRFHFVGSISKQKQKFLIDIDIVLKRMIEIQRRKKAIEREYSIWKEPITGSSFKFEMEKCLACVCTMAVNRNGKYRVHSISWNRMSMFDQLWILLDFIANKMPKTHDTIRNALIRLTENATGKIKFDVTFYSNERTNEKTVYKWNCVWLQWRSRHWTNIRI